MACYGPLQAYQCADGSVVFDERRDFDVVRSLSLPCGQCIGCRLDRSVAWAVRCMHEAQLHEHNCFVTLTYSDEHLPAGRSLRYADFQAFMHRLRKYARRSLGVPKVRFYMCGEYGEELGRPHFHALLFGIDFPDKRYLRKQGDYKLYTSAALERLWTFGLSSVGSVTFQSAAYCARYCVQKVTGDAAEFWYEFTDPETGEVSSRVPEFNRMSLKPGLGAGWLDRFRSDAYPRGTVVVNGVERKSPRFYDKRFEAFDFESFDAMSFGRFLRAKAMAEDNSPERLKVREKVARARAAFLKRKLT